MHPVHFLRNCVNPPEILPQGFLGRTDQAVSAVWGRWAGPTWWGGGRGVPAARGAALHVGWAGLGSCQRHRSYGTSGGKSIMQCWHRNVCLEQVTGHNSGDCLPEWISAVLTLPQSRRIYPQMNSSRRKEPLVSWVHRLYLWEPGTLFDLQRGCWFLLSLLYFPISCFHLRDIWLSSAWHLVSHSSKCNLISIAEWYNYKYVPTFYPLPYFSTFLYLAWFLI